MQIYGPACMLLDIVVRMFTNENNLGDNYAAFRLR